MTSKETTEYSVNLGGKKVNVRHSHRGNDSIGGRFEDYSMNANIGRNVARASRLREEIERHEGIVNSVEEAIENSEIHRTWLDCKIAVGRFEGEVREWCEESTRREEELEGLRESTDGLRGLLQEQEYTILRFSEELRERVAKLQRDLAHEEANGVYAEEKRVRRMLEAFAARNRKEVKASRIRVEKLRKRLKMIERYEGTSEDGENR